MTPLHIPDKKINWVTTAANLSPTLATEEVYDKYAAFLFFTITNIIPDKQQAEKTLVDVFRHCHRNLSDFNPKQNSFRIWLMNNARNIAIDTLCSTQKVDHCDQNFKSLSLAEKTVFALFYFRMLPVNEIISVLHLSDPVVKKLLQSAEAKAKKVS